MVAENITNEIKETIPWLVTAGVAGFAIGVLLASR